MAEEVDPRLVDLFQEAVAYARAGEHSTALATYRQVLTRQRVERMTAAPRFIATTQLQTAYTLMDLNRLDDAARVLAEVDHSTFQGPQLYDYYFTLGNVLGGQGRMQEMFDAFVWAISTAEDLEDATQRPALCWKQMIAFAVRAEDWHYVIELADKAQQVAAVRGFADVRDHAIAARDLAQTALGQVN